MGAVLPKALHAPHGWRRRVRKSPRVAAVGKRGGQREEDYHRGELRRLGWTPENLAARRKSDPGKVAIAMRLRRETTLTIKHLAARLIMRTSNSARALLREWQIAHPDPTHPVHSSAG